jgi:hypothetical protein
MEGTMRIGWIDRVRRAALPGAALAAAGLLLAAQACGQEPAPRAATTEMDASWAGSYRDLPSLKRASTAAVAGTVTAVAGSTVSNGIPYTDFQLTVTRVAHDPQHRVTSRTVIVHQTGGMVKGHRFEIRDDPQLRVGERVVLFLKEYAPGRFSVVGGPQGRFETSAAGTVAPVNQHAMALPARPSVDQFLADVSRA